MEFRHEIKHEITAGDLLLLRQRLPLVMNRDPHAAQGVYRIRSLYFDTPEDTALREKLDGVSCREKFRLRYYNADPSFIRLEKKSKAAGLCSKETASITARQVEQLLEGETRWMLTSPEPLHRELYAKMNRKLLSPKTIVDYIREPYTYPAGNVRVTLDYDIRTGLDNLDFLNPDSLTVPVGGSPIILEVKWDQYLPDLIRDLVQLENCRAGAFSKYAQCRIYG